MAMLRNEFDAIAQRVLDARRFNVRPSLDLRWCDPVDEEISWELFHGRALDHTMTRQRKSFRAWNVIVHGADEPLLSLKFDEAEQLVHVTRAVLCHVHATVSPGNNVVETSETTRWVRELVGSSPADERLFDELSMLVFQAVVGTSRLPLTSLESPLPAFTLGQLGHFPEGDDAEIGAKQLEFALRCGQQPPADRNTINSLKRVFHGVSLSPYTDFVTNVLGYLHALELDRAITATQRLSFLSYLLRLQWRHLNAYDLRLFHHGGANYPDALLIDEVLTELLAAAAQTPALFDGTLIRRGLRLGWLLRTMYQGHRVPSQPTSPGENVRVLPRPFERVTDEEMHRPAARARQLFDQPFPLTSAAREVLASCFAEMAQPDEARELGTALIGDRPLGVGKSPLEPDRTPLFTHIVQSRKLGTRVLQQLKDKADDFLRPFLDLDLAAIALTGVPLLNVQRTNRPGVISLTDVRQSADDFVVVATTRSSLNHFRSAYDWSGLPPEWLSQDRWHIVLPTVDANGRRLQVFDPAGQPWLALSYAESPGFLQRRGIELPAGGLRARAVGSGDEFAVFPAH